MSIELTVTSSRIGGNPGGKCLVNNIWQTFPAYYKFCYGSRINGPTEFRAPNQPIYEALTFALARKLGLETPETFVLLNDKSDVKFNEWRKFSDGQHDPSGRKCYFVSKLIEHPVRPEGDATSSRILESHKPYLESLLIADIINIKQNYSLVGNGENAHIRYLDLGCSFVHAKQGFLLQQNKMRIRDERIFAQIMKTLKKYNVINVNDNDWVDIVDFIERIPSSQIPTLNPGGFKQVKDLLSPEELNSIMKLTAQGFYDSIKHFDARGLLIKTA